MRSPFRLFSAEIEELARDWRGLSEPHEEWRVMDRPGSLGGGSHPFPARCGSVGGVAKPGRARTGVAQAAHEKIASDLAYDLGVAVPPVVLWTRHDRGVGEERCVAVSALPFSGGSDWERVKDTSLAPMLASRLAGPAAAIAAFDTWISNRDRANGRNLRVRSEGETMECAYLDYGHSLSFVWKRPDDFDDENAVDPFPGAQERDVTALWTVVDLIERLPADAIKEIVRRIPLAFLSRASQDIIEAGLLHRGTRLRRILTGAARKST